MAPHSKMLGSPEGEPLGVVGDYTLLERIGAGGMAEVFKAPAVLKTAHAPDPDGELHHEVHRVITTVRRRVWRHGAASSQALT